MRDRTPTKPRRRRVQNPPVTDPCMACSATGQDWDAPGKMCMTCDGRGYLPKPKPVEFEEGGVLVFAA